MTDKKRAKGKERLTDPAIRAWLRKAGTDALHDGGGLYLRRRAAGAFWSLRQVNPLTGARTWAALFPSVPYPAASLTEARSEADIVRVRTVKAQTDRVRERKATLAAKQAESAAAELAKRQRVTVRQLFERWAIAELKPHTGADGKRKGRKDKGAYTRQQFDRRVFPILGEAAAPTITRADLLGIIDAARGEDKLRTAGVLLTDLKQMFAFAAEREIVPRNPLDTVRRSKIVGKAVERSRVLAADELAALAKAVPTARMSARGAAAVWLILSTGCRIGEAMGARWEHVNVLARTWHLPDTKNQRPHTIHLSDFALRQIEELEAARDRDLTVRRNHDPSARPSPWVFPNKANAGPVCVKSFGKQLADRQREPERRMQHRSKTTKALTLLGGRWTAHDLRRTAATMMAELGVSGDTIDECLNHVIESSVRRTYIRDRRLAEQARAFDALGAKLAALVDGVAPSNVVTLRAA